MIAAAVAHLGNACRPIVCLNGFPNNAMEYLLLGLGFCAAQIKVHTDHDRGGVRIAGTLFERTIDFEAWHPGARLQQDVTEEQCLPLMLEDLRS